MRRKRFRRKFSKRRRHQVFKMGRAKKLRRYGVSRGGIRM